MHEGGSGAGGMQCSVEAKARAHSSLRHGARCRVPGAVVVRVEEYMQDQKVI